VAQRLVDFLPTPTVEREGDLFRLDDDRPRSVGKVRSFYGNFGMLVRAYAYIRAYGSEIGGVARDAVLNARYLQAQLGDLFPMAVDSPCMHEFVCTTKGGRVDGLRAVDVAKRLLAAICAEIVAEAERDLAFVQAAPHNTPVERVDEVRAARQPVLRWMPGA
jgi:glycine dehydrogenase subunit 2